MIEAVKRTIGIVGGMGPEATADLFSKILKCTPANKDQDHLHVIINSNPNVPDRTAAILGDGPSPIPVVQQTVARLVEAGVDVLVMPCNTAHYFHHNLIADLPVPFLHMMEEVVKYIVRGYPLVQKVGLLATSGTIYSRLYESSLVPRGLELIIPDANMQTQVMDALFAPWGVKACHYIEPRRLMLQVGEHLVGKGAEVVILGCTEIPLVVKQGDLSVDVIDSNLVLAQAAVNFALGREFITKEDKTLMEPIK